MIPLARKNLPYDSLMALLFAEAAAAFEELTLTDQDDALTWQSEDAWPNSFRKARFLSAVDHIQAERLRRLVMEEMDVIFRQADLIIGPALAGPMLTITNFIPACACRRDISPPPRARLYLSPVTPHRQKRTRRSLKCRTPSPSTPSCTSKAP
jgi:hypothetical protein